jgi:hypothetical protein
MKITAFLNVLLCSIVGSALRFRGAYCLHHQGDLSILPDHMAHHPRSHLNILAIGVYENRTQPVAFKFNIKDNSVNTNIP